MAGIKKARVVRMLFCDFCGKSQEHRQFLIQGRDEVHICDVCVSVCADMIIENRKKQQPTLVERAEGATDSEQPSEAAKADPA